MSLTPEQTAAVEKILADHRKELDAILQKHKTDVTEAVERIDKQKSEQLKRLIDTI